MERSVVHQNTQLINTILIGEDEGVTGVTWSWLLLFD